MAKTLVAAKHSPGPHENGVDGCHGRLGNGGMCPGVEAARWLNSLGEDDEPFTKQATCGMVRDRHIAASSHLVAVEPKLAELRARARSLAASLRIVKAEIKRYEATR